MAEPCIYIYMYQACSCAWSKDLQKEIASSAKTPTSLLKDWSWLAQSFLTRFDPHLGACAGYRCAGMYVHQFYPGKLGGP